MGRRYGISVSSSGGFKLKENSFKNLTKLCRRTETTCNLGGQIIQMSLGGAKIRRSTFAPILNSCPESLSKGKLSHALLIGSSDEFDIVLNNICLNMYSKCWSFLEVVNLFDNMDERDVISWTALIAAYVKQGSMTEALQLYKEMHFTGIMPNEVTSMTMANGCVSLAFGKLVHGSTIRTEFESHIIVRNSLINMYSKCGNVEEAKVIFDAMEVKDVVTWNTMVAAFSQYGSNKKALQLFHEMRMQGIKPNKITFVNILNTFHSTSALKEAWIVHEMIVDNKMDADIAVMNALINMYSRCEVLFGALAVFERIDQADIVAWSSIISACGQHGHCKEAFHLFFRMQMTGVKINQVTIINLLAACSNTQRLLVGKLVHAYSISSDLSSNTAAGNALIYMYHQCGSLEDVLAVFQKMHKHDVISWSALIAAYGQHMSGKEIIWIIQQMHLANVQPNLVTFINIIHACSDIAALASGKLVHSLILHDRYDADNIVGNALICMYSKCGTLKNVNEVFNSLPKLDLISWSSVVAAYSLHAHAIGVLLLFKEMQQMGVVLDMIALVSVLSACSHAGLVDDGCHFFVTMAKINEMKPLMEHHGSIIDLVGRAGWLDEAEDFINEGPLRADYVTSVSFLNACKLHGDTQRGKRATGYILQLNNK